tara:strand:+ start:1089 stop:1226 length:138 start_codon:yes stop_codon:yes gene_type:complete
MQFEVPHSFSLFCVRFNTIKKKSGIYTFRLYFTSRDFAKKKERVE